MLPTRRPTRAAAPAFWCTLAVNLAVLWLAVVLVTLAHLETAMLLPLASLGLSGVIGVAAVARPHSRRFGVACLGGAAGAGVVFALLLVVFFVSYFVLGGHELS